MNIAFLYACAGVAIFCTGLWGLVVLEHWLRKVLALAIISSAVFLVLVALAHRAEGQPDPVPHVMVLTGIVVAVSGITLALTLIRRIHSETGATSFPEGDGE